MGYLKDIANQPNRQTFPNSTFEIVGEVPPLQCAEAKIEDIHGITGAGGLFLQDIGKFIGFNLAAKILHITAPPANVGLYTIQANNDDLIATIQIIPIASTDNVYFVSNGLELTITRDIQSFANFISDAGYAYTIKGSKLYTNIPSAQLQNACTLFFDPLT